MEIALKAAVLIDGGHLRVLARNAGRTYDPDFIETMAHCCLSKDETLLRALYCDCAPFTGKIRKPVSGEEMEFTRSSTGLKDLASCNLFATRMGVLKFRGFKPKRVPVAGLALTGVDFKPDLEQRG